MVDRFAALAVAASLLGGAVPALAADMMVEEPAAAAATAAPDGLIVTLKATGVYTPRFEGTKDYTFGGYPGVSVRRPGQPWKFGAPDDGFGFAIIDRPWIQLGPVARIRPERNSSKVDSFRGMDEVSWAVEPGAFAEVYPLDVFRVRGELRYGVGGYDGIVGNIAADYIQRFDRFTVSFGPRTEFGGDEFMNTYYGVSIREAGFNGRVTPYKAEGGFKSVGLAGAVTYDWSDNWSATGFGAYNRLVADAADSPIAKTIGTKDSYTVGLGLAYSFSTKW